MANSSSEVKLISECYVKPKNKIEATKNPHYLNIGDLVFLPFDQMQRGLLFSIKPKNVECFVETIKKSLSIALVDFYPLAGLFTTVKLHDENARWVYVDCEKGPGARVIHANAMDVSIGSILGSVDVPTVVRSFFDLGAEAINYDGHDRPLLSIQVTELVDGLFLGFTMNHSVGDGTSLWHFISSLSEIYVQLMKNQGIESSQWVDLIQNDLTSLGDPIISRKPFYKPYFPKGYGPIIKLPGLEVDKSVTRTNNYRVILRERIFHFSSKSMSNLKRKANEECGIHNEISSFQALSAFMWRSITRARNIDRGLETTFVVVMNARPRFKPPISNDNFGNIITRHQSIFKVGEVLDNGLGWAAMLIHQLVVTQDDETIRDFFEKAVKFLCEPQKDSGLLFYSPNLVLMGGSTRFDMYGSEFGLGKAEASLLGYCSKEDGKITASPGRQGDGSVDLEVCLKPETMIALETNQEFLSYVNG